MRTISDTGPPVFCALLQPSYELFNLFDRVIIMSQGEIAWQGYREDALPFFSQLGKYRCHENLNPAEFLRMWLLPPLPLIRHISSCYALIEEIVESDSVKERNAHKFREEDDIDLDWHTREDFIEAYKTSNFYQDVIETIDEINATGEQEEQKRTEVITSPSPIL